MPTRSDIHLALKIIEDLVYENLDKEVRDAKIKELDFFFDDLMNVHVFLDQIEIPNLDNSWEELNLLERVKRLRALTIPDKNTDPAFYKQSQFI